jgi:hypothetical protein
MLRNPGKSRDCIPSDNAFAESGCTSMIRPSAPAANAARDIAGITAKTRRLFPIFRKREENVTGHAPSGRVAGGYKQHASRYNGSCVVDGSTVRFHAIHGRKLPRRIKIPQDRAIEFIVSAYVPVERSGKDNPGNRGSRRRLRRAAACLVHAGRLGSIGRPDFLPGCDLEREQAAARFRIRRPIG